MTARDATNGDNANANAGKPHRSCFTSSAAPRQTAEGVIFRACNKKHTS